MYILNAFSINMIAAAGESVSTKFTKLQQGAAAEMVADNLGGMISAVGHAPTAAILSSQLGVEIPENRISVSLAKGDVALIGQYVGPRLAEGSTTLPEGATIQWYLVEVE